jgi:hypothetical protein
VKSIETSESRPTKSMEANHAVVFDTTANQLLFNFGRKKKEAGRSGDVPEVGEGSPWRVHVRASPARAARRRATRTRPPPQQPSSGVLPLHPPGKTAAAAGAAVGAALGAAARRRAARGGCRRSACGPVAAAGGRIGGARAGRGGAIPASPPLPLPLASGPRGDW